MALSDCMNCWVTPCLCGYEYVYWDNKSLDELEHAIRTARKIKELVKDRNLSRYHNNFLSCEEFNELSRD